ncbi:hypothetical protein PVAP13_6NG147903 [Panicum virgatum]|uniref:TTF-type domain-containing protein n=2 Tax=Panicum virgatum TaxID=38727 RepID=A0A8T0R1K3_PANVG|nr:hypothetical protein PVAP13_6NG147903 [Panicum virgatum]
MAPRRLYARCCSSLQTGRCRPLPAAPATKVIEEEDQEQASVLSEAIDVDNILPPQPQPQPPTPSSLPVYDINRLPHDPGERLPIASYDINDQDAIRRTYVLKKPFKPINHEFPKRKIGNRYRSCSPVWLYNYDWLEYSIKEDAAFCFFCYLFKNPNCKAKDKSLLKHMGSKVHKLAEEKYIGFINPNVAIDNQIEKWSDEDRRLYKIRLTYTLRCIKFLLHQGMAFRGHDESEESSNRGNFIELLKFLAANSEEVNKYVLKNAIGNCSLTSSKIQTKRIIEELGDEPYAILADESSDISHKEQLALCLRFVDKLGRPCEHFIGVVHVDDTSSLSLKEAIEALLVRNGLTITQIRGQGYDGASNMKGGIKGLKTLIMKESPSVYYIHCFAHQLQLVLVAVAKGNTDFSCKRHGMLRNAKLEQITKALDCGELESGSGLNQEMGLPRPGDTRWGSHYKTICNIIAMYPSIHEVLVNLGDDPLHKADWTKIHFMVGALESFEFVVAAHLMFLILGYTNELSECLQRREQDILNAISLVNVAKNRMQQLRTNGWEQFLERVTLFCNKHGVQIPVMEDNYVPYGKSARYARNQTNDDHFRREIYIGVIDQISQELDYRFDEINMELFSCMSAFNPSNSFASFDAQKLLRLAEFYPNDIKGHDLMKLELQLDNYIDDVRQNDSFKGLVNLVDLSVKLVQTNRHTLYDMVYLLLKLVLLLPVATASVERVFSAMTSLKTKKRNKLGDALLYDCLVTFIERDIFFEVDENDIIKTFMSIRNRRPDK